MSYYVRGCLPKTIFFMGNSLMSNSNPSGTQINYQMRLVSTCYTAMRGTKTCQIQNYSVPGIETIQMISAFPTGLGTVIKPNDIVFFWEYINDMAEALGNQTYTQAYNNSVTYAGLVRAKGAKIIVGNAIPNQQVRASNGQPYETDYLLLNALIASNWSTYADGYIDLRTTHFQTTSDCNNATYYDQSGSKTHLTDTGYDYLANYIAPLLTPFI